MTGEFNELAERLRRFTAERDWEQFHSPKNLAMALAAETGELLEHFQWLTEAQSRDLPPDKKARVAEEIADVQNYLIRLADQLGIDIPAAVHAKILHNEAKYPADKVRGDARKYNEYGS